MLFALLLGMALNFLAEEGRCVQGIQLASTVLLRIGVALLGLRITLSQVEALGLGTVVLVVVGVGLTVIAGIVAARMLGLGSAMGTLTGGAVAMRSAAAALAIASILPRHDVAQVVGAGYAVSNETGDTATIVKLLRVAMQLPVCLVVGLALHVRGTDMAHAAPILPWFAVAFAALVVVTSLGWIPQPVIDFGASLSRWCLVTAIAAIGMKTSLRSLAEMGLKPVALLMVETVFLAALFVLALAWT